MNPTTVFAVEHPTDGARIMLRYPEIGYWQIPPDAWESLRARQTDEVTEAALAGSVVGWGCPAAEPAARLAIAKLYSGMQVHSVMQAAT